MPLCIGCDAQLACASRLSHFTLLGNDPTLRGLHPLYLTPLPNGPFPWCPPDCYRCQRTPTGHATLGGEIAPALTPPRARMSIMPRPMMRFRTLDIPHHALVQRSRTPRDRSSIGPFSPLRNDLLHTEASRPAPLYARCAAPPAHHARPCSLTAVPAGPSSHLVGLRSAVHPAA